MTIHVLSLHVLDFPQYSDHPCPNKTQICWRNHHKLLLTNNFISMESGILVMRWLLHRINGRSLQYREAMIFCYLASYVLAILAIATYRGWMWNVIGWIPLLLIQEIIWQFCIEVYNVSHFPIQFVHLNWLSITIVIQWLLVWVI